MIANIVIKPKNIEQLLKNIEIIYSTKEQENSHILQYFDSVNVKYRKASMPTCDYSAFLPKCEELGLPFDITLEKELLIERKAHLNELANNICQERSAFQNEWIRARESGASLYLVIESGSFADIDAHRYRSQYNEKAYYNTLLSWREKYGFHVDFVTKELIGKHILRLLQLKLKHILEG